MTYSKRLTRVYLLLHCVKDLLSTMSEDVSFSKSNAIRDSLWAQTKEKEQKRLLKCLVKSGSQPLLFYLK